MEQHVGWKRCRDNKIVKLEIRGVNNESRDDIVDKRYAIFKCSEAFVLDIYDPESGEKFTSATSLYDKKFEYTLHEGVKVDNYSSEMFMSHPGIHYFLTEEAAIWYDVDHLQVVIRTEHEEFRYYGTGQLRQRITSDFNKCERRKIDYWGNGNLMSQYTCIEGKMHGEYKKYYRCGQLEERRTYSKGKKSGEEVCFYENGQLKSECNYIEGKKDGEYKEYHKCGQLKVKCTYSKGKEDGKYREYFSNGNSRVKCTYKNGTKKGFELHFKMSGSFFRQFDWGTWSDSRKWRYLPEQI